MKWAYSMFMGDKTYSFVHAYCAPSKEKARARGGRSAVVASGATCAVAKRKANEAAKKKFAKRLRRRR